MEDSRVAARFRSMPEEEGSRELSEGALLAAALAAALVEYRNHVAQKSGQEGAARAGERWRTVGCWERLQGGG